MKYIHTSHFVIKIKNTKIYFKTKNTELGTKNKVRNMKYTKKTSIRVQKMMTIGAPN